MPLMGLLADWTQLEKRLSNWRICQQNALKQKGKEKRDKNNRIRTVGQLQKV